MLASEICKRLGFDHVEYTLDTYKDMVVSKCPCFITKDTELITCNQIRNDMKKHNSIEDYEEYTNRMQEIWGYDPYNVEPIESYCERAIHIE